MKNNQKLFTVIISALTISGCAGIQRNFSNLIFPPFPSSDQRSNESVKIKINYFNEGFLDKANSLCQSSVTTPSVTEGLGAAPVAAMAAEFAVKQVVNFLEEEAKRYTAAYSKVSVGEHFWECDPGKLDDTEGHKADIFVNLKSFTVTRFVNKNVASELTFKVVPSKSKDALLIFPIKVKVNQSKAKVALFDITRPFGFDILAPWTIFNTIKNNEHDNLWGLLPIRSAKVDLKIDISIKGAWLESEGKWHSQDLVAQSILLPSQNITGNTEQVVPQTNSNYDKCENSKDFLEAKKSCGELFNDDLTFQPPVPRSSMPSFTVKGGTITKDSQAGLGFGTFALGVLVTEYDSFGERVTQLKDGVKSNEKSITESLTSVLNGI